MLRVERVPRRDGDGKRNTVTDTKAPQEGVHFGETRMPLTRIPERYEPGLITLASLRADQVAELVSALNAAKPVSEFSAFADAVHSQLKNWKRSDVYNIIRTCYSLAIQIADEEMSANELASQVAELMRASGRDRLAIPEDAKQQFVGSLALLIGIDSIKLASKAYGLRRDHERWLCDVKIITDLRPVFADVHQKPTSVIVGHTLKLGYHEDGEHREFYVALDGSDVAALKKALQRAEDKESSLRNLVVDSGLKEFDHT